MADDLIAFLKARRAEDQAAAMAATGTAWAWEATGDKDNSWAVGHVEGEDGRPLSGEIEHGQGIVIDGVCESINGNLADAAHIARHDPARVLRDVEADRKLLAEYERSVRAVGVGLSGQLHRVVLAKAAVHSDHPDYRPEWAPDVPRA